MEDGRLRRTSTDFDGGNGLDDAGKEGRKGGRSGIAKLFEMLNVVCSADVNIPQIHHGL